MSSRFYRPELDVVRLLAFTAVFFHHGLPSAPASTPVGAAESALGFGLPLFFTLSAYLITTLLLKERERTATVDLPRFYKRRILRIWPLYFGALALSAAGSAVKHTLHSTAEWYLAALFMLGNVVTWQTTSVIHLWSISIEEQFYVFWPTAMRKLSRRSLFVAAVLIIVASQGTLAYLGAVHADTWKRVWWNSFVQMEFFGAGILLALHDEHRVLKPVAVPVRVLGLLAIAGTLFFTVYSLGIKGPELGARGPASLCLGYALVTVCCVALIYLVQGMQRWPKPLVYFGKISYGLYVFHVPVLSATARLTRKLPHVGLLLPLAITMLLGWLSYTYYESPFLRLKERFEVVKSRPVET